MYTTALGSERCDCGMTHRRPGDGAGKERRPSKGMHSEAVCDERRHAARAQQGGMVFKPRGQPPQDCPGILALQRDCQALQETVSLSARVQKARLLDFDGEATLLLASLALPPLPGRLGWNSTQANVNLSPVGRLTTVWTSELSLLESRSTLPAPSLSLEPPLAACLLRSFCLNERVAKAQPLLAQLASLPDTQTALLLLRHCASFCRVKCTLAWSRSGLLCKAKCPTSLSTKCSSARGFRRGSAAGSTGLRPIALGETLQRLAGKCL